ncbi:MAG: hypothetical protein DRJ14_03785 [Acidobacteria bacterium]|nr:MAG: hypothetical protein DRJ14_03785 [Acidobacteriota bacterium]
METNYEFELSKIEEDDVNRSELLRKAQEFLDSHPLQFTAVLVVEGRKFVLGKRDKQHIFIEPLTGFSSLLFSRAMFTRLQKNSLTRIRGLNHNVRGPLSGIRSRLELLTRKMDESPATEQDNKVQVPASEIKQIFGKILQSADNLQKQITDFEQVLSWLNPEQDATLLLPVQVLETLREYLITDLFVKRNIQIVLQPQPPVRSISIHPTFFVEPVLRIIDNAVESLRTKGGGKIQITVSSSGSDCVVEIQNDGPRIPEKILDISPYEPGIGNFDDGVGMGLAFSKWLVDISGGEISILQNEDSCVNFRLRYPRRP